MRDDLRQRLAAGRPLVADGATGTELGKRGLAPGACSEGLESERPEVVAEVAASYAAAGSDLVYTNSFGANPWRLERHGLAESIDELNQTAAELARRGVGDEVYVLGSMGPTGDFLAPLGGLAPAAVEAAYARQAAALLAGGADGLVIETFAAVDEVTAAVRGARSTGEAPIFATLTYGPNARTMMGVTPEQAVAALLAAGADVVGLNCGDSIEVVVPVLEAYRRAAPEALLLAKPNAGMPVISAGVPTWPVDPTAFAAEARRWVAAGARIIGGCCGTQPDYVAALAGLARELG